LQEAVGTPNYPSGAAYRRALTEARARVDETAWKAAWEVGRATRLEEAVAYVVTESE
jgi:hypothetical protein